MLLSPALVLVFFFFNDTATTEIYTLSLHDALPIFGSRWPSRARHVASSPSATSRGVASMGTSPERRASAVSPSDRKSTRLNSSHDQISYAVFCLKKKKEDAARMQPKHNVLRT